MKQAQRAEIIAKSVSDRWKNGRFEKGLFGPFQVQHQVEARREKRLAMWDDQSHCKDKTVLFPSE